MKNSNTSALTRATARDERGQGLVEYALIIALVSLAAVLALGFLSGKINTLFSKTGNVLNNVAASSGSAGGGPSAPAAPNVTSGPAEGSSGNTAAFTSPSFSFTGDGTQTGFQCSLDLAAFSGCTSPQAYSGLGAGSHSFRVQASNGGGTSTPATRNWAVTVSAPSGGSVQICAFSSQSNANSNTSPDCSPPYSENNWLRANTSGWSNMSAGDTYSYTWTRYNNSGCNASPSSEGTGSSTHPTAFHVMADDADNINGNEDYFHVSVVATNAGGPSAAVTACVEVED